MSDVKIIPSRRLDGIGRRAGLKIPWWRHRVGSTPTAGTMKFVTIKPLKHKTTGGIN